MDYCRHCGLPLPGSSTCSCPKSMLAAFDVTALEPPTAMIDQLSRIARSAELAIPPPADSSILDAMNQLPKDFPSRVDLARLSASKMSSDTLSQISAIQDRVDTWKNSVEAHRGAARDSAETIARLSSAVDTSSFELTMSRAHLQDLTKPLMDSWLEASSIKDLAPFRSDLEDLAKQVVRATELWQPLRESSDLRFAWATLASLKKAIDQGPYADRTIAALRDQFGDWSAAPWIDPTLDSLGRLDRYFELGLEPRLVSAPPSLFREVLSATEIREEPPPVPAPMYLLPEVGREDQPVEEWAMVEVHRRVRALESRLRELIDREMTGVHGSNWFQSRTPPDVLERARERRKVRLKEGTIPRDSLLMFVDFGDYPKIICRKDNWPLFASYFRRTEAIQESFARLTPLRADDSHSRTFSSADHLFFHAEILRLHRAMDGRPNEEEESGV